MSRAIGIDNAHKELDSFFRDIFSVLKSLKKLLGLDHTVIVLIEFLKRLEQEFFLLAG